MEATIGCDVASVGLIDGGGTQRSTFRRARLWIAVIAVVALWGCAEAPTGSSRPIESRSSSKSCIDGNGDTAREITKRLGAFLDDQKTFGVTAGFRFSDGCESVLSVGVDGRSPQTPESGNGRFLIASVTKTFIAAEVMALAEQGVVSLDDTIEEWMPDFPNAEEITIQELLTHTSGLSDIVDSAAWRDALLQDLSRVYSLAEALELMQPTAANAPGRKAYANVNYTIAAIIVEKVTGNDLSEELSSRFLDPLGMLQTTVGTAGDTQTLEHGWFTLEDNGWGGSQGERASFDNSIDRDQDTASFAGLEMLLSVTEAHGGMVSTIDDLLTWGVALADGTALGAATDDFFFLPTPISVAEGEPAETGWGTGWLAHVCPCELENTEDPSVVFSFHDGETLGSRSMLAVDRANGIVIAVHANTREITDDAWLTLAYDIHTVIAK